MTQTEFTQRVLTMQDRLYRVSCTLLRCEADREDAVQSALEKAWRGRFLLRSWRRSFRLIFRCGSARIPMRR